MNAYGVVLRRLYTTGRFKTVRLIADETGLGFWRVREVLAVLVRRGYVIRWGFIHDEYILSSKALPLCERMFKDMEKPEFWDIPF